MDPAVDDDDVLPLPSDTCSFSEPVGMVKVGTPDSFVWEEAGGAGEAVVEFRPET